MNTELAPGAASPPAVDPPLAGRMRKRALAILPWASLAVGIAGAIFMDRGPSRGAFVAGATVAVWITLLVMRMVGRRVHVERLQPAARPGWLLRAAHFSSLLATQSLVHLGLYFALPFYVRAATWDPGHGLFLLGLVALALVSLWDPLSEKFLTHPLLAPLLPAFASFVALPAVLPGLGLSIQHSLWLAAILAGAGMVVTAVTGAAPGQRAKSALLSLAVACSFSLALALGAARIVPAAPLRLVAIAIGTQREGRWLADATDRFAKPPARLVCATAIASPLGVRDRLFHVWTRDGQPRARVELDIRGGREAGFRTYSRIGPLGAHASGVYRCRVETQSGQVLGSHSVRVGR